MQSQVKLSRKEVIKIFLDKYGMDINNKLRMTVDDHGDNSIAPERYCYKVSWTDKYLGRRKLALWPNTVGYQSY